jgi:hypothetical protein
VGLLERAQDDHSTSAEHRLALEAAVMEPCWTPPAHASTEVTARAEYRMPGVVAVIPAYNEDRFIGSLVLKAREYVETVIVVDDGSTDDTAFVARAAGAIVVRHRANYGKGVALDTGLRAAQVLAPRVVVALDGDGQHRAEDIPTVARPALEGEADLVVGSRFLGRQNDIPSYRVVGQHALTLVTNLLSGAQLTDSQSGFRALSRRALKAASWRMEGFAIESEMQFLVRECGLTVAEVPIWCSYAEPAKRSPVAHGLEVMNGIIELTSQVRPLLFFSILSSALLATGTLAGVRVIRRLNETGQVALGTALVAAFLLIVGVASLFEGITLHTLRTFFGRMNNWQREGKDGRQIW